MQPGRKSAAACRGLLLASLLRRPDQLGAVGVQVPGVVARRRPFCAPAPGRLGAWAAAAVQAACAWPRLVAELNAPAPAGAGGAARHSPRRAALLRLLPCPSRHALLQRRPALPHLQRSKHAVVRGSPAAGVATALWASAPGEQSQQVPGGEPGPPAGLQSSPLVVGRALLILHTWPAAGAARRADLGREVPRQGAGAALQGGVDVCFVAHLREDLLHDAIGAAGMRLCAARGVFAARPCRGGSGQA